MLELVFVYFVGRGLYNLSEEFEKSKWLFAILGVVIYYIGIVVSVFIIAAALEFNNPGFITEDNNKWIGLFGVPFGLLAAWGFYAILKHRWRKEKSGTQPDTLDGGMINNSDRFN